MITIIKKHRKKCIFGASFLFIIIGLLVVSASFMQPTLVNLVQVSSQDGSVQARVEYWEGALMVAPYIKIYLEKSGAFKEKPSSRNLIFECRRYENLSVHWISTKQLEISYDKAWIDLYKNHWYFISHTNRSDLNVYEVRLRALNDSQL